MDNIEMRTRYIAAYRQQLRRETEEMGYGRPRVQAITPTQSGRINLTSALPIIAASALALSLVLTQI